MKTAYVFMTVLTLLSTNVAVAESTAVDELLAVYSRQGATAPDAQAGKELWLRKFPAKGKIDERSCSTCHGVDLRQAGEHIRTKKLIEPMAPSVNAKSLTNAREIRKWFKRNCKWTLDRECTAAEKANLLVYIKQQ